MIIYEDTGEEYCEAYYDDVWYGDGSADGYGFLDSGGIGYGEASGAGDETGNGYNKNFLIRDNENKVYVY